MFNILLVSYSCDNNMETRPDAQAVDALELADRRRPGRRDDVSPELVELLRGTGGGLLAPGEQDGTAPLSAAQGVAAAMLLSSILWVVLWAVGIAVFFVVD
jgi:hypothetical protein